METGKHYMRGRPIDTSRPLPPCSAEPLARGAVSGLAGVGDSHHTKQDLLKQERYIILSFILLISALLVKLAWVCFKMLKDFWGREGELAARFCTFVKLNTRLVTEAPVVLLHSDWWWLTSHSYIAQEQRDDNWCVWHVIPIYVLHVSLQPVALLTFFLFFIYMETGQGLQNNKKKSI